MKGFLTVSTVVFLQLMTAYSYPGDHAAEGQAEDRLAIAAKRQRVLTLVKNKDAQAMYSEIFLPQARVILGDGTYVKGKGIADLFQKWFDEGLVDFKLRPDTDASHTDICGNLSVRHSIANMVFRNGTEPTFRFLSEWRKVNCTWYQAYLSWIRIQ